MPYTPAIDPMHPEQENPVAEDVLKRKRNIKVSDPRGYLPQTIHQVSHYDRTTIGTTIGVGGRTAPVIRVIPSHTGHTMDPRPVIGAVPSLLKGQGQQEGLTVLAPSERELVKAHRPGSRFEKTAPLVFAI